MDKEFDNHDDDENGIPNDPLDNGNVDDSREENTKPDRKLSIREALTEAVKKSNNEDVDDVKTQNKPVKNKINKEEAEETEENNEDEDKGEKTPSKAVKAQEKKNTAEKPDTSDENNDKPAKQESKSKAPVGWTKEAKAKWDSLPAEVRDAVAKREKEVSDGFKQYGEKAQDLQKYETLIEHYGADYQQYGFNHPSQLVERAFQWVHALRNPNKAVALNSFKQLAQSLGIEGELAKVYGGTRTAVNPRTRDNFDEPIEEDQTPQQVQYQTDPSLVQAVQTIQTQLSASQQQQATNYVNSWAADKPHFERVRKNMYGLLASNSIPLKNGEFDLDEAYNRAVRMDPELYEEMVNERLEAEREANKKKAAEKAEKQKNAVERARKANISLKPNAPTIPAQNNQNSKKQSIRDTIKSAVREVNGR